MKFYLISETELDKLRKITEVNIVDKDTIENDKLINVKEVFYSELTKDVKCYINDKIKEYYDGDEKLQKSLEEKKEYIRMLLEQYEQR